jgi:hypothetical protein
MPDGSDALTLRSEGKIAAIPAAEWDGCAGAGNPFVGHAFLSALEESGSASDASGWTPNHLLIETAEGRLLACAPLYVKSHSFGEYVFDWSWAEAWQRAGRDYYPKLQCAVPFTPVSGPRLLIRPGAEGMGLERVLAEAMTGLCDQAALSSAHVTFPTEAEARGLEGQGWLLRIGEQYHWPNRGYASFDDFLGALSSRKRKTLRKERQQAAGLGVTIQTLSGDDIKPRHWDAFHRFYLDTVSKKWGQAYLNREFFARLGASLAERVALVIAEDNGRMVAGALNLIGDDALYGRNWGALGEYRFLHFEMCYYRAIDFAIARGLARVEAGAQGEHKVSRGYLPVPTYSAHWIREAPLRRAVAQFLTRERQDVAASIRALTEASPYRAE